MSDELDTTIGGRAGSHSAGHRPVLPARVAESLLPSLVGSADPTERDVLASERGGAVYVDCTAGLGGHAVAMLEAFVSAVGGAGARGATWVLCDLDAGNLERATSAVRAAGERLGVALDVVALHASFVEVPRRLVERGLCADAVLADLGFSSTQVDDAARGLSFRLDGPLDMRFDRSRGASAADLVRSMSQDELAEVLRDFGEEPAAKRIAGAIVAARSEAPITTTGRLAAVVRGAAGPRGRGGRRGPAIDRATKTFQALRIAVNDELGSLEAMLEAVQRGAVSLRASGRDGVGASIGAATGWLAEGSSVGVISFHSLEDRRVKRAFARLSEQGLASSVTRRPLEADAAEIAENPRSRSAKLRVAVLGGFHHGGDEVH